jgi:hypothetical protein
MKKLYFIALIIGIAFGSLAETRGQISNEQQKAQEIAAFFNKSKRKDKEKRGVVVQKSSDTTNEPVVKRNISEYSGSYKSDNGGLISLRVKANDDIEVGGYDSLENQQSRYFKLRNAKIKDGLLTGSKIYDNGSTENFEAAFFNRTSNLSIMGSSRKLVTIFGLGVKYDSPITDPKTGLTIDKLFYGKQQSDSQK